MEIDEVKLDSILEKYGRDKSLLLGMFQDIQREYRYLPKEAIKYLCERLNIPVIKGYEMATFYKALSLVPRGRHTIHVCMGTACHLKGAPGILEAFERELKIKRGGTTDDMLFTLESVNCLGACALAPLVRIDEKDYGKVNQTGVKKIIEEYKSGE
ncbi:MAG: NAD(P)H-dependent oxidoreductase subunit E [Deltaproteobacteria bacterium]|nr:NAD(P)H-dependent oxidoreductase subunit E [Deltaproteobacteria bacterium]